MLVFFPRKICFIQKISLVYFAANIQRRKRRHNFSALQLPVELLWSHWSNCVGFLALKVATWCCSRRSRQRGKTRTDLSDSGGPLKVRLLPASDWSRNSTSSSSWDTWEEQSKLGTRFEIEEFKQQKWLEKLWIRQKKSRIRTTFRSRNSPVSGSLSYSFYSFLHVYTCTNSICKGGRVRKFAVSNNLLDLRTFRKLGTSRIWNLWTQPLK